MLKGIDLEIQKGEVVTIVGASGAGRAHAAILGTLDAPDKGKVFINDKMFSTSRQESRRLSEQIYASFFSFTTCCLSLTRTGNVMIPGLTV